MDSINRNIATILRSATNGLASYNRGDSVVGRSKKPSKRYIIIPLIFIMFLGLRMTTKLLTSGTTFDKSSFVNTDCDPKSKGYDNNKEMCGLTHQHQKFIWMFVDSMAYDQFSQIKDLPQLKNGTSHYYRVLNRAYKNSYSVYTTMWTGQAVSNFAGKRIHSDNIFNQMKRAGYEMNLYGSFGPSMTLLGPEYFKDTRELSDEKLLFEHIFGKTGISTQEQVDAVLDKWTNHGTESVYTPTGRLDRFHHLYTKYGEKTQEIVRIWRENTGFVIDWVNRHPEYLLLYSSDHGGDTFYGESNQQMHGPSDNGNECFLFVHGKGIAPIAKSEKWINVVDVCPTLTLYFKGLSIPAESIGIASPTTDSPIQVYKSHRLNVQQIARLANKRGLGYDSSKIKKLQWNPSQSSEPSAAILKGLLDFLKSFSQPLIENKAFPTTDLFLIISTLAIAQIFYVVNLHGNFLNFAKEMIKGHSIAFHVGTALSVYWLIWFNFWKYHEDYITERFYFQVLFFGICLYYTSKSTILRRNNPKQKDEDIERNQPTNRDSVTIMNNNNNNPSALLSPGRIAGFVLLSFAWQFSEIIISKHQWFEKFGPGVWESLTFHLKPISQNYLAMIIFIALIYRKDIMQKPFQQARGLFVEIGSYALMILAVWANEGTHDKLMFRYSFIGGFIHIIYLVLGSSNSKRRLVVPFTFIQFLLLWERPIERLSMFVVLIPQLYFLSKALQESIVLPYHVIVSSPQRYKYVSRSIFLLLLHQVTSYFVMHEGVFSMNLDPMIPGIPSAGDEAMFSGVLMLWRKYWPFMLYASFLIRAAHVSIGKSSNSTATTNNHNNNTQTLMDEDDHVVHSQTSLVGQQLNTVETLLPDWQPESDSRSDDIIRCYRQSVVLFIWDYLLIVALMFSLCFCLVFWHYFEYYDIFMLMMIYNFNAGFFAVTLVTPNVWKILQAKLSHHHQHHGRHHHYSLSSHNNVDVQHRQD